MTIPRRYKYYIGFLIRFVAKYPLEVRMSTPDQTKLDLRFVSISHPDEIKSRRNGRKIRQHVMKDIGLSRRKKQSNQKVREVSDDVTSSASYQQFFELQPHSTSQHGIIPPPVQPLIPNSDSILYSRTDTRAKMMKEFRKSYLS